MRVIAEFELRLDVPEGDNPNDALREQVERMAMVPFAKVIRAMRLVSVRTVTPWEEAAMYDGS